ncbi:MAG TPA: glycosyltransferase family 2 protein [Anaerolineales bacterium]|nr:glycosyltransferase family 2 protein [Anaerolineales bacterium]HLO31251.1 glycosyltransferase family 2 protein [Anaerolineales bacterium]
MRFSVIIPLFNKALYIRRALGSVLAQTVQDFEVVVVDDGSIDGSADLVREYTDPRIRLIGQANAGASAARNRGIAESKADLIAFLDADDQWNRDFLEQISFLTAKYPAAGLFATSYRMFNGVDTQYPQIRNLAISEGGHGILDNYLKAMLGPAPFYTSSTVVRKEIVQRMGGFPIGVALGEDLDTWLRIYFDSPMAFMYSHPVVYFAGLPASVTSARIPDGDFAPIATAQKFIDSGHCDAKVVEDLQEYIAHNQVEIAKSLIFHNKHDRARQQLRRIRKTRRYVCEKIFWAFWAAMPHVAIQTALRFKAFFRYIRQSIDSRIDEGQIKQSL